MPHLSQGDIFKFISKGSHDLAVIFGHFGFNHMGIRWTEFRERTPEVRAISDPFSGEFGFHNPVRLRDGTSLIFVAEEQNHGIADHRIPEILQQIGDFIRLHNIRRVVSNGIRNVDPVGRESDDRRAQDLIRRFAELERRHNVEVTLTSLNDVFVRQQ